MKVSRLSAINENQPSEESGNLSAEQNLHALLFETSPYGNLDAIVQHDERALFFYLNGDESFGTRACWVRNLVPAPLVINKNDLEAGRPPLMPKTHCRSNEPGSLPDPTSLSIVWLEEGNGAALFEQDQVLAIIPPWSGTDGFHGYSTECVMESPIAWPMIENDQLMARINNARQFWESCTDEAEHPFSILQPQILHAYQSAFGQTGKYYSLDGGKFPPRGAMLYRIDSDIIIIASVGMSLRPQPNVEMSVEHPAELRRIELAIRLSSDCSDEELTPLLEQFSGLVGYPWQAFTWFGVGHTCQFNSLAQFTRLQTETVRFESKPNPALSDTISMPVFRGDPVQLLWLNP